MAKRDIYLEKIHTIFIELGVGNLTMDEIAKKIGVTKMTLYNNFKDKEALINEILIFRRNAHTSYMMRQCKDKKNAIEMLISVLDFQKNNPLPSSQIFYKSLRDNYPRQFFQLQEMSRKNMEKFIRENMIQGINEGVYRDNFDPDQIISYIIATMNSTLNQWVIKNKNVNLNLTHEQFINYHIRGIANEKGTKILEQYQNDKL